MKKLLLYFSVLLAVGFSLGPFLWECLTSLKPTAEILSSPISYLPNQITLSNYITIFTRQPFARYILNSFIVACGTTFLALVVGTPASYALARLPLKGKGFLQKAVLLVALFPPVILVVPLYEMVMAAGLANNYLALILPYTALNLPFVIWVLTGFFRQVPRDIEDAALVDGFSRIGLLAKIILPISAPALATTAILVFIFSWNEFILALTFMSEASARTIPVGIAMLTGVSPYEIPWGQIAAAVVATTLPLVLVVLFLQRKIIEGLTAGAVKG
ncbi:MAG: carbohydrate ABC transporter permease [Planctomycetes bacterium]|nr:carbohydrate ABC transporter permease [Planctomycetota bacterium]